MLLDEFLLSNQLMFEIVVLLHQQQFRFECGQEEALLKEEDLDLSGQVYEIHRGLLHLQLDHVIVVCLGLLFGQDMQAVLENSGNLIF